MSLCVERADPRGPEASALLRQSQALMKSLFPPEDNYFLDIDALAAPHIAFFAARDGAATLGTGALADMGDYGEVKSMFVAEPARGRGVGAALLARIEAEARARALPALKLETGDRLAAAHRLYAGAGFVACARFGDYPESAGSSLFMEKVLA